MVLTDSGQCLKGLWMQLGAPMTLIQSQKCVAIKHKQHSFCESLKELGKLDALSTKKQLVAFIVLAGFPKPDWVKTDFGYLFGDDCGPSVGFSFEG